MTTEEIRERLRDCKVAENAINTQLTGLDKTIKDCQKQKKKLAMLVSKNMKYRNSLIEKLNK